MNNKFFLLFKKEMTTILRDKKSIITFVFMSLFFTPLLIGGLGAISDFQAKQNAKEEILIGINNKVNDDLGLSQMLKQSTDIKVIESNDLEKDLSDKKLKGYIIIDNINNKLTATYIYDQTSNTSTGSLTKVQNLILQFTTLKRQSLLHTYKLSEDKLNPITFLPKTLQEVQNKPQQNSLILFFLPYIILVGLIQGAAQFAIELTAGEKERNTLATTLSLNTSRITIGLAKIAAILIMSLFSLILNVMSIFISFSYFGKAFGGGDSGGGSNIAINLSLNNILQLFLILLPLSFLVSALLILIGIYARNQKEGSLYILPLVLASLFIGFSAQAYDVNTPIYVFAIPLIGHVALIKQVLLGTFIIKNYILSAIVTILLFLTLLYISINMFKKEEIIFRK